MNLRLKSCTLRPWSLEDAASATEQANNRKIWLNMRDVFPHPYSREDAEGWIAVVSSQSPATALAIEVDGLAVGGIGAKIGDDVHRLTAEIGYWLGESYWSRGIMSEVIPAFAEYLLETFSLQRVFAAPYSSNLASIRILQKAGFTHEGRTRKSVLKDGVVLDQEIYALVRN